MVAVMGGQGFGGLFASLINLATLAVMDSAQSAAFIFFILAMLFTAFIWYLYVYVLAKNEVFIANTLEPSGSNEKLVQSKDSNDFNSDMSILKLIKAYLWPYMIRYPNFECICLYLTIFFKA